MRLSKESEKSGLIPLKDKSVFKIGNSAMYEAKGVSGENTIGQRMGDFANG